MANTILFVFEGEKAEKSIFHALRKEYFQSKPDDLIIATYNAEIYQPQLFLQYYDILFSEDSFCIPIVY